MVPASTLPRQPSQLSQAQQPVSLPIAQQQLPATRPPGLPTQEEINRAKNEIEQMKTSLLNNQRKLSIIFERVFFLSLHID